MDSERYVAVGTRVDGREAPALLALAARYGVPVRAAALQPPGAACEAAGSPGSALTWHRLRPPGTTRSVLGGRVRQLTRRVLRGQAAELLDALVADEWLEAAVVGRTTGSANCRLVALDDTTAQALGRWQQRRGVDVPLLTWDQAAERLAEVTARAVRAGRRAPVASAEAAVAGTRAGRNPGAMHRLVVAAPAGTEPRAGLVGVLQGLRAKVEQLEPGAKIPETTDVLVLDGVGPVLVHLLDRPPALRTVYLPRAEDGSSPWRHLLHRDRLVVGPVDGGLPDEPELAALVLGDHTARLVELTRARKDDDAVRLAEHLLESGPVSDPLLLREMTYLARVTGSLGLEQRVLRLALRHLGADEDVQTALARVMDKLRETDPGWWPALPPSPVAPVPGRVLHLLKTTLPQRQAGYSVRGHHTLRALLEAGADVVAVAVPERLDPDAATSTAASDALGEAVRDGVRYVVPDPVPTAPGTAYLEEAARVVLDVVRAERPAVLHVHSGHRGYDLGVVGAAVAEATGLPWVYEVRGLFESTWTRDQARAERGETFERRMAREADLAVRADATVTLAETMRADLVARGVPQERVHVVPNAVDPEQLRPQDRDPALERRYESAGRFVFGYVSNLDHAREQVEDLVRAAVLLRSRGRPTLCLVVGTGSREKELRSLAERLGAGGCVAFTGRVPHEEVSAYYALLDVLVVPRGDERAARLVTPLKPFEAMAMGVPVVVSSQPALLEVVGDAERGWSYPPGDAVALADLLERLADAPQERAAVAARARDWVVRERTWAGNAIRYLDIYDHLTGSAGRAAPR